MSTKFLHDEDNQYSGQTSEHNCQDLVTKFKFCMKRGTIDDLYESNNILQQLVDSGFQMPIDNTKQIKTAVGPKPKWAKFVPPWKK